MSDRTQPGTGSGKMTVKDIEARLDYLADFDIHNPEVYELLKQLAAIFIFQNKYVYGYSDIDAVCHDVAADTYMRMLSGRTKITHWIYYIGRSIKLSYITQQRAVEHEVITTEDNPELQKAVIDMCAGSSKSINNDFNHVFKVAFLENIDALIRQTMNGSRFKSESKEWWILYTDLCLSLYYDKPVYFRTPPYLKQYVPLLIRRFRELFVNSEFMEPVFDEDEDLPTLLFYDEQALKDSDKRRDI